MRHARGERWAGVDVESDGVADNMEKFVWEPALVKINALEGAAEAACLVLSVDETVTNPSSSQQQGGPGGGARGGRMGGGGRGRGR